jgi:hypothetical protein
MPRTSLTALSPTSIALSLAALLLVLSACGDDDSGPPAGDGGVGPDLCDGVPDADGDTISDRDEAADFRRDTDGDTQADYLDRDSDNDGLLDAFEAGDANCATPPWDSDEDGVPNYLDLDSDNNGIPDAVEGMGDLDGDGIPDYADLDDDGDMIPDVQELGPGGLPRDTDSDGIPDHQDVDSDGDTILDLHERDHDTDRDGTLDRLSLDADGDGIPDAIEAGDSDPMTPPVDSDGDGLPDYRDLDSDNDGLPDALELAAGTDPSRADTDGDGVTDLIEVGAGTDPLDDADSPRTRGDFVFVMPFDEDPEPRRDTLRFRTNIQFADVYFLFDTTGSMSGEIASMRSAVVNIIENVTCEDSGMPCVGDTDCGEFSGRICGAGGTCIENPETAGCIASLWTGLGTYEGNPNTYRNLLSLQPDPTTTQRTIPTSASGGGALESLFESVACVADPTACSGAMCDTAPGGVGCPAYRSEAVRVLVTITDEPNQCTTCTVNSALDAGARLRTTRLTFVGVDASTTETPRPDLEEIGRSSDSLDGSGSPLYFQGNEARVTDAVTEAIREVALGVPLFVVVEARDLPDDAGDALQFILRTEVNLMRDGCTTDSTTIDLDSDGFDDAFPFLLPGTPVCWDVVARRNTRVPQTDQNQVFKAELTVLGDDSPLDSRTVFFLVPPDVDPPMFD